jgi:hypothetical protein
MNEHILAPSFRRVKAEAFLCVEEFNCSDRH